MNEKNQKYPLKISYQVTFIKHLIKKLEEAGINEILDGFYENLTALLKCDDDDFSFKHFLIKEDNYVTFKESNSFIRDGTTGLKVWPAAIKLCKFILMNQEYFNDKSILELGSGASGFVGLTLVKATSPRNIFLSDCHDVVINNLIENVKLNLKNCEPLEVSILNRHHVKINNSINFGVLCLPWEEIDYHKNELMSLFNNQIHIILAADVIYDDKIFTPLLQCLNAIFNECNNVTHSLELILSQTIRNEDTFHKFCKLLSENSFVISQIQLDNDDNNVMFPCDALSLLKDEENVKILKIKKKR